MQFLLIFLVYALAVGNAEECTEQRAEACIENLLSSILQDSTEEQVCTELKTSVDCLRSAVDECISEEDKDDEIEEGLQELEKVLNTNCGTNEEEEISDEEKAELQKCYDNMDEEKYTAECIAESAVQALELFHVENDDENQSENDDDNLSDLDEDVLQCTSYALMTNCVIAKIGDECGEKAAALAEKDLSDMPPEIKHACEAAGDITAHTFQLLDKKRK